MDKKKLKKEKEIYDFEKKIYDFWEKEKFFSADTESNKLKYSLLIPPPNLTGELHLGHAMQHSILDAVARFKRLQGFDVLLLPGVDHAGIQFESIFDKILAKQNLSKQKLGREEWLKKAWEFKGEVYKTVSASWRIMGLSADWSREVFTLDEGPKKAVFEQFKTFWEKGLIYKGPYIVQWCPKDQTAIEDVEVEYEERKEKLYYLRYPLKDKRLTTNVKKYITIATVRPETMFADVAVVVNPKDKRYKNLIGEKVIVPFVNREVPIITDESVDIKFGSGVVKVDPAHDLDDFRRAKEYKLEIMASVGKDGKLTALAGEFAGLKTQESREKIIESLDKKGLLEKVEDIKHNVSVCERCKTPTELLISDEWFLKIDDLAKGAIKVIKGGKINFLPKNYARILVDWLLNIHDWCISRSLWWGHRIPVWYCNGKRAVGKKMGFAESVVTQLFTGKTKTYRLKDKGFVVGDRVAFENSGTAKIVGFGTITNVTKTIVSELPLDDPAHGATYKKIDELILAFKKHYPELEVDNNTEAYIYSYEFTPREKADECCGLVAVSLEKPPGCPKCGCNEMKQDEQVLDTWFSSGLWPLSTLGWSFASTQDKPSRDVPDFNPELKKYFPWDFEISAGEIKYLWIARMIMISNYFTGKVPFSTMFFHGMLRDLQGRKFSKSLGNGIEPQYLVDRWGVDATRMALYTYSVPGRDGRVSREILDERGKNFRNFATKIRNIGRFVLELKPNSSHLGGVHSATSEVGSPRRFTLKGSDSSEVKHKDDKWIKNQLELTVARMTKYLENVELHLAVDEIYDFIWHKFADQYIEKSKSRRAEAQPVLEYLLKNCLILLHPFMPFLTEEIYQKFGDKQSLRSSPETAGLKKKSIMLEVWPS